MSIAQAARVDEAEEAEAFDRRILDRVAAGFVPDLRRAVKCEYFYKSFWRDPKYIDLYLGHMVRTYIELIGRHGGKSLRILDAGCGAGYFALELARAGHHVTGIDVSKACINVARDTAARNDVLDGFGSLDYEVGSIRDCSDTYDLVLFSGVLHHLHDVGAVLDRALGSLKPGGLLLTVEPIHESWRPEDAAQVALMRSLLSLTGAWYEEDLGLRTSASDQAFEAHIADVREEYLTERDKSEAGQSPNDNAISGEAILTELRARFDELEMRPTVAFIYRMLGGLRGPDETAHRIADLLAIYDSVAVKRGFLRPNGFVFIGRARG